MDEVEEIEVGLFEARTALGRLAQTLQIELLDIRGGSIRETLCGGDVLVEQLEIRRHHRRLEAHATEPLARLGGARLPAHDEIALAQAYAAALDELDDDLSDVKVSGIGRC